MGLFDKLKKHLEQTNTPDGSGPEPSKTKEVPSKNNSACPHCGSVLNPPPKRKKKCPECDSEIHVRTKQELFESNLLTEEQALASDFYKDLTYHGATLKDYKKKENELTLKWGFKPSPYDVVWGVSIELIVRGPQDLKSRHDKRNAILHHGKMITFAQAIYQANRGKDSMTYKRMIAEYEIDLCMDKGLDIREMELLSTKCCTECEKLNGKKFEIKGLKEKEILPIKSCTRILNPGDKYSWCTCMFLPVINS